MDEFKIEENIEVPPKRIFVQKYPFHKMKIGESFFCEDYAERGRVSSAATDHKKKHGREFTIRKDGAGFRVWRVA